MKTSRCKQEAGETPTIACLVCKGHRDFPKSPPYQLLERCSKNWRPICAPGLIDDGESPEAAALRELEEETGYRGDVAECSPGLYSFSDVSFLNINETGLLYGWSAGREGPGI